MKHIAPIISLLALAGTIVPAVLFLNDRADLGDVKSWMFISTIAWFTATPIWMDRNS